jgi:para-aminobenzoate synthetase/4-amino-4-deoxychorismate lyase
LIAPGAGGHVDASFSVAIRTLVVDTAEGVGEYGVGAGITTSSATRGAYDEAQAKTRILTQRRPEASLIERIRWDEGEGFRWLDRHLQRIGGSAAYFGFEFDEEAVAAAVEEAVVGRTGSCAVRLETDRYGGISAVVEEEDLSKALWWPNDAGEPLVCDIDPDPVSSRSIYRFHQTTARRPYRERRDAHGSFDEVLMVNERGELTEGTGHNVAVQIAGTWVTPPLACGCLPGVLRAALIDEGVLVEEVVTLDDLAYVEAIALLDSVHGWRPARLVNR